MKRTVEVEFEVTPQEAAVIFSDGGAMWQVEFFNRLAEDVEQRYKGGIVGFIMQMQYVVNTNELTPEAKRIMAIIGEYSA